MLSKNKSNASNTNNQIIILVALFELDIHDVMQITSIICKNIFSVLSFRTHRIIS